MHGMREGASSSDVDAHISKVYRDAQREAIDRQPNRILRASGKVDDFINNILYRDQIKECLKLVYKERKDEDAREAARVVAAHFGFTRVIVAGGLSKIAVERPAAFPQALETLSEAKDKYLEEVMRIVASLHQR